MRNVLVLLPRPEGRVSLALSGNGDYHEFATWHVGSRGELIIMQPPIVGGSRQGIGVETHTYAPGYWAGVRRATADEDAGMAAAMRASEARG